MRAIKVYLERFAAFLSSLHVGKAILLFILISLFVAICTLLLHNMIGVDVSCKNLNDSTQIIDNLAVEYYCNFIEAERNVTIEELINYMKSFKQMETISTYINNICCKLLISILLIFIAHFMWHYYFERRYPAVFTTLEQVTAVPDPGSAQSGRIVGKLAWLVRESFGHNDRLFLLWTCESMMEVTITVCTTAYAVKEIDRFWKLMERQGFMSCWFLIITADEEGIQPHCSRRSDLFFTVILSIIVLLVIICSMHCIVCLLSKIYCLINATYFPQLVLPPSLQDDDDSLGHIALVTKRISTNDLVIFLMPIFVMDPIQTSDYVWFVGEECDLQNWEESKNGDLVPETVCSMAETQTFEMNAPVNESSNEPVNESLNETLSESLNDIEANIPKKVRFRDDDLEEVISIENDQVETEFSDSDDDIFHELFDDNTSTDYDFFDDTVKNEKESYPYAKKIIIVTHADVHHSNYDSDSGSSAENEKNRNVEVEKMQGTSKDTVEFENNIPIDIEVVSKEDKITRNENKEVDSNNSLELWRQYHKPQGRTEEMFQTYDDLTSKKKKLISKNMRRDDQIDDQSKIDNSCGIDDALYSSDSEPEFYLYFPKFCDDGIDDYTDDDDNQNLQSKSNNTSTESYSHSSSSTSFLPRVVEVFEKGTKYGNTKYSAAHDSKSSNLFLTQAFDPTPLNSSANLKPDGKLLTMRELNEYYEKTSFKK